MKKLFFFFPLLHFPKRSLFLRLNIAISLGLNPAVVLAGVRDVLIGGLLEVAQYNTSSVVRHKLIGSFYPLILSHPHPR